MSLEMMSEMKPNEVGFIVDCPERKYIGSTIVKLPHKGYYLANEKKTINSFYGATVYVHAKTHIEKKKGNWVLSDKQRNSLI